jgi:CheY-like chemotaxis protein
MPKVLLVEDDNNLREIFQMRLQAEGYATTTAADGEEGLVAAMKEKPDLIIADVMMPKLSGFEMIESLRAAPETKDIKVIMMTALGQAEDQARGEKLGVVKYLVKSQVTLEDFARVVKEALGPGDPNAAAAAPKDEVSNNNQVESENSMQNDQTNPMNPASPAPADPAAMPADPAVNPVSGDAPADSSVSTDQQSTAQEETVVQNQVNDFAAAPSSDAPAAAPAPDFGGAPAPAAPAPEAPAPESPAPAAPSESPVPPVDPTTNAL